VSPLRQLTPKQHRKKGFRLALRLWYAIAWMALSASALDLSGSVCDPGGVPLPEATVWLIQPWAVHTTATGADGRFAFGGLTITPASAVAYKPGYAVGGCTGTLSPNLELRIRLETPDTLALRIIDRGFLPIPGARIKSMTVSGQFTVPVEMLVEQGFPSLRSGDDGALDIPMLPKGGFVQLVLSQYQYADARVAYLPVRQERQSIVLPMGIKLRGRVTDGRQGVAGARVSVFRARTGQQVEYAEVLTDPEGFYSARVPAGEYRVAVRHPRFGMPEPVSALLTDSDEETVVDVALPLPRVIEGSVAFADGEPSPGVSVLLRVNNTVYDETYTGEDGAFELRSAHAQFLLTVVPPPGYWSKSLADIPVNMGEKTHAEISPVKLEELPLIEGTVLAPERAPAANVLISSLDLEYPLWTITDAQGRFGIRLNHVPIEAKARFRAEHAERFLDREFKINLKALKPAKVRLRPFEPDQAHRPPETERNNLYALVGQPAPALGCGRWFNGPPVTIESLKGKVVVLTFWAGFDDSPFGVNRIEQLRALQQLLQNAEDVAFVAVHDGSVAPDEARQFVQRAGIAFPVGLDEENFPTFEAYLVNFIPQTVLIDKTGILRYFEVEGRLLELIKALRRKAL